MIKTIRQRGLQDPLFLEKSCRDPHDLRHCKIVTLSSSLSAHGVQQGLPGGFHDHYFATEEPTNQSSLTHSLSHMLSTWKDMHFFNRSLVSQRWIRWWRRHSKTKRWDPKWIGVTSKWHNWRHNYGSWGGFSCIHDSIKQVWVHNIPFVFGWRL